eukprot:403347387
MGNIQHSFGGGDIDGEGHDTPRVTVIHYHNGDKYEGQILRNLRDGFGVYICSDKEKRSNYEYIGNWKNNLRDGEGKCYFYSGDLYVGAWKQGKRHGQGDHFYRKGERYTGDWKNDMKDGTGTLVSSNGAKYVGRFKQDRKHLEGQMILPDGTTYQETWEYGVLKDHKKIKEADKTYEGKTQTNTDIINASMKQVVKTIQEQKHGSKKSGPATTVLSKNQNYSQNNMDTSQMSNNPSDKLSQIQQNVLQLLKEKQDLLTWSIEDVLKWLQAIEMQKYESNFQKTHINGYALVQIREYDLETHLKVVSLGHRKKLIKSLYFLKALWISISNQDAHGLNFSERSSMMHLNLTNMQESQIDFAPDQSSYNIMESQSRIFNDTTALGLSPDFKKESEILLSNRSQNSKRKQTKQILQLSMAAGQSNNGNRSNSSQTAYDDQLSDDDYLTEQGLVKSFKASGFNFFINFEELTFDLKNDFIGGGGYGDVFQGRWLGTRVAVKKFGKRYLTKKAVKDFIKEIEVVNQLRHPNIVLYMGVTFDTNNFYYMITEFVNKGSLFELLHQKKIPLDDDKTMKIAKQMAMALQYIHRKKILHCDLKSQNILLNDDWTVKICDFGLARYREKFQKDNHGKIGTPHWMAPEILRGEKYLEPADVYSYGVILWEMLVGEIPYMGRSISQITGVVGYHKEKLSVPLRCNKHLRKIVNNCLIYEPHRRPTFDHIIKYIERVERKPKFETSTPLINKLGDFLS